VKTCFQCGRPAVARGLCRACYQRAKYHHELPSLEPSGRQCGHCGQLMVNRVHHRAKFCSPQCKEAARTSQKRETVQSARTDRTCRECGCAIPVDVPGNAKVCSIACGIKWQNRKKSDRKHAASMARRATRGPCAHCGDPIPVTLNASAVYCSRECRIKANSIAQRLRMPHYMREYMYGVTQDQYEAMLAAQDGVCAICRSAEWPAPVKGGRPHVDHSHASGKVRGLLCGHCNNGLGQFGDDPARLRAAADYLERAAMIQDATGVLKITV
jgi:predicted nucleic acid-binding Zn ribbon protein